jgi:hypothetical protein
VRKIKVLWYGLARQHEWGRDESQKARALRVRMKCREPYHGWAKMRRLAADHSKHVISASGPAGQKWVSGYGAASPHRNMLLIGTRGPAPIANGVPPTETSLKTMRLSISVLKVGQGFSVLRSSSTYLSKLGGDRRRWVVSRGCFSTSVEHRKLPTGGHCAHLWFTGRKKYPILDPPAIEKLTNELEILNDDASLRALFLRSTIAGADIII